MFCAPILIFCAFPSASFTFAIAVKGGAITTSTAEMSSISSSKSLTNSAASACSMFIFQLAATIFLRRVMLFLGQGGHSWQFLAFEQFQRGATAGRNKSHLIGDPGLFHRRYRIAATDDGRGVRVCERPCDRKRAFGKIGNFKNTERSVPQNGFCHCDFGGE